jgi:hypothetical protein
MRMRLDQRPHPQAGLGSGHRPIRCRASESPDREVRIADRLDLLDPGLVTDLVEAAEKLVELGDEHVRRELRGDPREPDEIAEEDGHVVVAIRNPGFAFGKPIGNPARQDVQQQASRLRTLLLELPKQARHDCRVRILELLELPIVGLETAETALEAAVLLVEVLTHVVPPPDGVWICHGYVAPRSTATIVALWNCDPSASGIGAISPTQ